MYRSQRLVQSELDLAFGVNKLDAHADTRERVYYAAGAFDLGAFGSDPEAQVDVRTGHERLGSFQEKTASADVATDKDLLDAEALAAHFKRFPVALSEASFDPNFHGREKRSQEPCGSRSDRALLFPYATTANPALGRL